MIQEINSPAKVMKVYREFLVFYVFDAPSVWNIRLAYGKEN
jgi:hypothetical protein